MALSVEGELEGGRLLITSNCVYTLLTEQKDGGYKNGEIFKRILILQTTHKQPRAEKDTAELFVKVTEKVTGSDYDNLVPL